MTKIYPIRLLPAEVKMLELILASEFCEQENGGELFRLWLHREWNKRHGFGQPAPSDYQSSHRGGLRRLLLRLQSMLDERITNSSLPDQCRNTSSISISLSPTRAANGLSGRTKNPRATRRAGFLKNAGKLK